MMKTSYYLLGMVAVALVALVWVLNSGADPASAQSSGRPEGTNGITTYNATSEFSLTQGGTTGVWRYGYTANGASNTFIPFPTSETVDACGSGTTFQNWTGGPSQLGRNATGSTFVCGGIRIPADVLYQHPGSGGERTVLRWTAPASGTYLVNGVYEGLDSTSTDARILKNATEPALFSGLITGRAAQLPFSFNVTVIAGDTIDFSLGGNGNFSFDATGVAVTIGQPVTACSAPPLNLQVSVPGENSPSDVQSNNTNAALVGDAFYTNAGKVGRAFTFDGNGDYVRVEDNPAQKPINQLTVEGWYKFNTLSGLPHLIAKPLRNSNFDSYAMWYDNGNIRIGYYQTNQSFNFYDTGYVPQTGVWTHYAFVLNTDGTGTNAKTQKLFVNGVEVFSGVAGNPIFYNGINDVFAPYPLLIGADFENNNPQFFLDGQADEVSLYDRALSQTELFNIVRQGSFGKCQPARCTQAPQGLVSWYQGEDNALDARSNNHGALINGTGFANGKVGRSFSFDGLDDKVDVPNSASLDIAGSQLTIEAWVNPTSTAGDRQIVSMASSVAQPSGRKFGLFIQNGSLGFEINAAGGYGNPPTAGAVPTGTFTHVAGVYNGTQMVWYINGIVAGTSNLASGNIVSSSGTFALGQFAAAPASYFNGLIDEAKVYNRALSQSEIQSIVASGQSGICKPVGINAPANQVAWYSGGGDTRDLTLLNPSNGILRGDTTYRPGKVDQAFSFDGNGDFVEVANNTFLNPTAAITLETWVKATGGQGTDRDIISKDGEISERQYVLTLGNTNQFRAHIGTANGLVFFNGATTIPLDTWTHVAMTYDGAMLKLYVNGVPDGQQSATGAIIQTTQPLRIGGGAPAGQLQLYFTGLIDESSIFSRALSASEIAAIYNAGSAGKLKSVPAGFSPAFAKRGKALVDALQVPATYQLSDATVTFANIGTPGVLTESGIDLGLMPRLPLSSVFTGLAYDISTTAGYTSGSPDDVRVCFNLPSLAAYTVANLRILHLENGVWINRTAAGNTLANFCTVGLTSLSPFAIVNGFVPTAAGVTVSGRVTTAEGRGISGARISVTGSTLMEPRVVMTGNRGYYIIEGLTAGQTYIVTLNSRKYTFTALSRVYNLVDDVTDADFTANPTR